MWSLHLRMWLLVTLLFGIIYAVLVFIGTQFLQISGFYFYFALSLVMIFIQYMIGPKIVEWSMRIRYISRQDNPRLFQMVEELSRRANIPMPKVGIAQINIPNAFAFGRSLRDGRVCVTQGILTLLGDEELKAVLGHEISHLKNRDVLTITLLSVIPMILYRIAWQFLFYGRRRNERDNSALIGLVAFIFYFITNLLVLYASRIREYFADLGSVKLGAKPHALASSLYKLVYGAARTRPEELKEIEGLKAFFLNDLSKARTEIRELAQLDFDRSGTLDEKELSLLQDAKVNLTLSDKIFEILSTHPNMLKRIKKISEYQQVA